MVKLKFWKWFIILLVVVLFIKPNQSKPELSNRDYGFAFGRAGLSNNTYISKRFYGSDSKDDSGFLASALFTRNDFYLNHMFVHKPSDRNSQNLRLWTFIDDRLWRATIQSPYFKNKIPGENRVLPAAVVIGAATAFGLTSLLPLNIPANKPLIYCNSTYLNQARIKINEKIYYCNKNKIEISCPKNDYCSSRPMDCDLKDRDIIGNIFCKKDTLLSKNHIYCDSVINENEKIKILNCFEGQLKDYEASFIPTTSTSTAMTPITTTEKNLSFSAKAHVFFLKLMGMYDVLEAPLPNESTTPVPEYPPEYAWIPEALTIPQTKASSESLESFETVN